MRGRDVSQGHEGTPAAQAEGTQREGDPRAGGKGACSRGTRGLGLSPLALDAAFPTQTPSVFAGFSFLGRFPDALFPLPRWQQPACLILALKPLSSC